MKNLETKGTMLSKHLMGGLVLLAMCTALLASTSSSVASAQEVQITGPLAGASAVRRMRVYREGRFQLQPFFAFTLQDEYARTISVGAQLQYHIFDWLGVGLWGAYSPDVFSIDTALTDEIKARGQTNGRNALSLPSKSYFPEQIGRIQWTLALQGTFIPLRGKLALFQKLFVDADFYLFAGLALAGIEERADVDNSEQATGPCRASPPAGANPDNNACVASQVKRAARIALAPTFGAGLSVYVNRWMALQLEWRGMPFSWNTSGTDEANSNGDQFTDNKIDSDDRIFHFNHMFVLGWSFYLPTGGELTE